MSVADLVEAEQRLEALIVWALENLAQTDQTEFAGAMSEASRTLLPQGPDGRKETST